MRVEIDSRFPVSMTVDADDFGKLFAAMDCAEQVAVLRAMIDAMDAHPLQWDYIAIELENAENYETLSKFTHIARNLMGEVS
jgi:hypothetical protein